MFDVDDGRWRHCTPLFSVLVYVFDEMTVDVATSLHVTVFFPGELPTVMISYVTVSWALAAFSLFGNILIQLFSLLDLSQSDSLR